MSSLPPTEDSDPKFTALETWPTLAAAQALWEGQFAALAAIGPCLPRLAQAVEASAQRLGETGRLIYAGAGSSARIAVQDGAELTPTFDFPPARLAYLIAGGPDALTRAIENAEDDAPQALAAIADLAVTPSDVVIAVAASGNTPYAVAAARAARDGGALTIGITSNPDGALLTTAEFGLLIATGAEPIAGSTRLKAGTAQKIVLNLISTLIMVRLGRVYRGQMVEMVAKNDKLRARARRMVMKLAGCDETAAVAALAQGGGNVKKALISLGIIKID